VPAPAEEAPLAQQAHGSTTAAGSGAAYQNPTLVCASPSAPVGSFWEDETLAYWLFGGSCFLLS